MNFGIDVQETYDLSQFQKLMSKVMRINEQDAKYIFDLLNVYGEDSVNLNELISQINHFRKQEHEEPNLINSNITKINISNASVISAPSTPSIALKKTLESDLPAIPEEETLSLEGILAKMEKFDNKDLTNFIRKIFERSDHLEQDGVMIHVVNQVLSEEYHEILTSAEQKFFVEQVDENGNGMLSLIEIVEVFKKAVDGQQEVPKLWFMVYGMLLDKRNLATQDFFYEYQLLAKKTYYEEEFISKIEQAFECESTDSSEIFEFLSEKTSYVKSENLFECVNSFRRFQPESKQTQNLVAEDTEDFKKSEIDKRQLMAWMKQE